MSPERRAQTVAPPPSMDFRALDDDAWYTVRLRLEGDNLRIMYLNFPEGFDEVHSVDSFTGFESIEKFRRRFRPTSSQLQDRNCDVVVKGMVVCASYLFSEGDLKFYDAVVESVNPSIHPLQEGQCRCKFELLWQHGPICGKKTIVGIEHLCLITSQGKSFNLTLENFLDIAKEKLLYKNNQMSKVGSCNLNPTKNSESENTRYGFSPVTVSPCASQINSSTTIHKSKKPKPHFSSSAHEKEVKLASKHAAKGISSNENVINYLEQDVDMGGKSIQKCENFEKRRTFYFCRIDNLEKDLSPFNIMRFVQEHLGISCSAFVCPTVSHEFCTRGFILVEGSYQAQNLMDFLLNGEYFIISSKGRPWVIDDTCCGKTEGYVPYEVKHTREEPLDQIKLVHKGTDEYEKIKRLHSLHVKFLEHVNFDLLGRLLADERSLMKQLDEE